MLQTPLIPEGFFSGQSNVATRGGLDSLIRFIKSDLDQLDSDIQDVQLQLDPFVVQTIRQKASVDQIDFELDDTTKVGRINSAGKWSFAGLDSAVTGGDTSGPNAVDLQLLRTAANQVPTANSSGLFAGGSNRVLGSASLNDSGWAAVVVGGEGNFIDGSGSPGDAYVTGLFSACFSTISGSAIDSFIAGGTSDEIINGACGFIIGGGGSQLRKLSGSMSRCGIIGGSSATEISRVSAAVDDSYVFGGGKIIDSRRSMIIGGNPANNEIKNSSFETGIYASKASTIDGATESLALIADNANITGDNCIAMGRNVTLATNGTWVVADSTATAKVNTRGDSLAFSFVGGTRVERGPFGFPGFPTASRPASPVVKDVIFDTTLVIPIYFDGTNWRKFSDDTIA